MVCSCTENSYFLHLIYYNIYKTNISPEENDDVFGGIVVYES